MKRKNILALAIVAGALPMLWSCSSKQWHAEGTIAGGEGKELVLEAPTYHGGWYPVDTVEIDAKGRFSVSGEPAGHPEVYRLTLDGQSVYFPIDSLETVSITAQAGNLGEYTVSGSASAERMQEINSLINKVVKESGEQAVAYDPQLKRALAEAVLRDPAGIVAYYTIFRKVGNTLLFDPGVKSDLRLIGAVANAFTDRRPSDPRTPFLASVYTTGRKALGIRSASAPTDTLVAAEISLPEISLLDETGKARTLTDESQKGKVLVLNFTTYSAELSPALNVELAKIYNANKANGFDIYQVSVGDDEFFWKEAARNLPWTTVYNSAKDGADVLLRYNVQSIPALFIINRQGELVERVDDVSHLASAVARYM